MKVLVVSVLLTFCMPCFLCAQEVKTTPSLWQQYLDDLSELDDFEGQTWEEYEDVLHQLAEHPININTATTDDDLVQITDTFTPILSDISVTYNGTVLPTSNYSYNQTTGVFSTNAGVINIPAATYVQNQTTGAYTLTPGTATVTVTGNI